MTQTRYRDWRAPVGSKDSMEPIALASGIGPQLGFDKVVTASQVGNVLNIELSTDGKVNRRNFYLTDKVNELKSISGVVITPDGIMTLFEGNISIQNIAMDLAKSFSIGGVNYNEVVLVATHLYVEDEELSIQTTIRAIPNINPISVTSAILPSTTTEYKSMDDWFNHPIILDNLDKKTEVILGIVLVDLDGTNNHRIELPYRYQWPASKVIPEYMWNDLYAKSITLAASLVAAEKHQVKKGTINFWDDPYITSIPEGYVFCGKYFVGVGSDTAISQYNGAQTNITILQEHINVNYNTPYGLSIVVTKELVTTGVYRYFVDFSGKIYNGIPVHDMTHKFIVNAGYDAGDSLSGFVSYSAGVSKVTLTAAQSGLPSHTHTVPIERNETGSALSGISAGIGSADSMYNQGSSDVVGGAKPASQSHENRPPFYALAYIKKVI